MGESILMKQSADTYACIFCGQRIAPGPLDPCALHLVGKIDRPRNEQKEQTFYCHADCLQVRAAIHPANFYIASPDFSSVGECDAAEQSVPADALRRP